SRTVRRDAATLASDRRVPVPDRVVPVTIAEHPPATVVVGEVLTTLRDPVKVTDGQAPDTTLASASSRTVTFGVTVVGGVGDVAVVVDEITSTSRPRHATSVSAAPMARRKILTRLSETGRHREF